MRKPFQGEVSPRAEVALAAPRSASKSLFQLAFITCIATVAQTTRRYFSRSEVENGAELQWDAWSVGLWQTIETGMTISREIFDQQRLPRFGKSNPERMTQAFWEWMIRGDGELGAGSAGAGHKHKRREAQVQLWSLSRPRSFQRSPESRRRSNLDVRPDGANQEWLARRESNLHWRRARRLLRPRFLYL